MLTEAAINGKVDYLRGLKENVIMGRLEVPLDAIPGYDEETRPLYAGGLPEDTGEESLAE